MEVLSLTETRYVFRVAPTIIDGVYYEEVEPVEVVLPPGATSAATVNVRVMARSGEIRGSITTPAGKPAGTMEILIIQTPQGASKSVTTTPDGTFSISDLPVDTYTITASPTLLAEKGYAFPETHIDLTATQEQTVNIRLDPIPVREWHGSVTDDQGKVLPFAWLSVGNSGSVFSNQPGDGSFTLYGVPTEPSSLMAVAPGYYSQTQQVGIGNDLSYCSWFSPGDRTPPVLHGETGKS